MACQNDFDAFSQKVGMEHASLELVDYKSHIALPSAYFAKVKEAVATVLTNILLYYSQRLDGLPLAFNNKKVKLLSRVGEIVSDQSCIHFDVETELVLFKPKLDEIIEGKIHRLKQEGQFSCLIHDYIYAFVTYAQESLNPQVGDEVLFRVTKLEHDGFGLLSINGELERIIASQAEKMQDGVCELDSGIDDEPLNKSSTGTEQTSSIPPCDKLEHQDFESGENISLENLEINDELLETVKEVKSLSKKKKKSKKPKKEKKDEKASDQFESALDCIKTEVFEEIEEKTLHSDSKKKMKKSKKKKKVKEESCDEIKVLETCIAEKSVFEPDNDNNVSTISSKEKKKAKKQKKKKIKKESNKSDLHIIEKFPINVAATNDQALQFENVTDVVMQQNALNKENKMTKLKKNEDVKEEIGDEIEILGAYAMEKSVLDPDNDSMINLSSKENTKSKKHKKKKIKEENSRGLVPHVIEKLPIKKKKKKKRENKDETIDLTAPEIQTVSLNGSMRESSGGFIPVCTEDAVDASSLKAWLNNGEKPDDIDADVQDLLTFRKREKTPEAVEMNSTPTSLNSPSLAVNSSRNNDDFAHVNLLSNQITKRNKKKQKTLNDETMKPTFDDIIPCSPIAVSTLEDTSMFSCKAGPDNGKAEMDSSLLTSPKAVKKQRKKKDSSENKRPIEVLDDALILGNINATLSMSDIQLPTASFVFDKSLASNEVPDLPKSVMSKEQKKVLKEEKRKRKEEKRALKEQKRKEKHERRHERKVKRELKEARRALRAEKRELKRLRKLHREEKRKAKEEKRKRKEERHQKKEEKKERKLQKLLLKEEKRIKREEKERKKVEKDSKQHKKGLKVKKPSTEDLHITSEIPNFNLFIENNELSPIDVDTKRKQKSRKKRKLTNEDSNLLPQSSSSCKKRKTA